MTGTRIALVPGVLALLPQYAGLIDPVPELRAACLAAVGWLGQDVTVLADPQGERVALSLVEELAQQASRDQSARGPSYLLVGNGSARRSEKAPGHLDDRAADWDDELEAWLRGPGPLPDLALGDELLAATTAFARLPAGLDLRDPVVDLADDPFGVQYWVMRWELT